MSSVPQPPQPPEGTPEPFGELHYHRLLVAVDGSRHSDLALAAGAAAARRDHAALTVICVAPDLVAEIARWPWPTPAPPNLQENVDRTTEETLRAAVERIPEDIPVTTVFRRGKPGPEIVAHAAESDYDAIVLGARGVGGVGAMFGSVSRYVAQHADTTVFTAHAPQDDDADDGT